MKNDVVFKADFHCYIEKHDSTPTRRKTVSIWAQLALSGSAVVHAWRCMATMFWVDKSVVLWSNALMIITWRLALECITWRLECISKGGDFQPHTLVAISRVVHGTCLSVPFPSHSNLCLFHSMGFPLHYCNINMEYNSIKIITFVKV